ncbi:MAG: tetratricopeptide repeat protein [Pseudomonadales bacterium]
MEEDQQQNQTQAARTPQDNALGDAIDALRSTLTEDSGSDGWRRDIAIVGIVAALFGIVAWYALVTSRSTPVVADMVIHTQLTEESVWVDAAFEQVFAAYMQAGNRVRLRGDATVVGGGVSMISSFSAPRSHAGARRRIDITLADDGDSTTLLAILEVTESDGTQLGKAVLRGQPDALSDLAARTALQVFDWLHIDPFSTGEQQSADTELPQTSDGTEPYARGVQALRRGEGAEAVRYLRRALELEPGHPMVNAMLAEALDFLGYQKQALQHIKIAFERRRGLSREKQLMIEARLHYLNHHWRDAQTQYAALKAFYPEELSYGLALASVQTEGNQLIAAYETLTNLRSSPFFAQDPLIDIVEAKIRRREGAWESGLAAAERAIVKAIRLDLRGVLARALVVAADLGSESADRYLDQADELMREMDDPFGRSQVLREKGDRLRSAGDLDASSQLYTAAMDLSLEAGNESEVDAARQALAIVRDLTGDLESGYELKCQVFASYQRREVHAGAAIMLENMGISLFKLGRLDEASERFSQALEQFQKYGDQIGVAWWPYHQGRIDFVAGRFASARTRFLEAEANAIEHPEGEFALHVRFEILRLNLFTGLDDVGQDLHDLVRAYEKKGLLLDAGESLVLLARYKARRGKRQEALEHIDRAEAIFRTSGAMDYLAQTLTQRVRLGDIGNCDALRGVLEGMQHQPTLLLGGIALSTCGENKVDLGVLQQQAERLGLFEPRLASLALIDPEAARRLAGQRGGIAQDYLSLP